jgi:ribose transport system ATP-binding protein
MTRGRAAAPSRDGGGPIRDYPEVHMLELSGISKTFPGVKALDGVSIAFRDGEVHGLVGENGAGKSTLIKIMCGVYGEYQGEVLLDGEPVRFQSYKDALRRGIAFVNQEIQITPAFSVAENIFIDKLERFRKGRPFLDWRAMYGEAEKYLGIVKLDLDPRVKAGELSPAQKQLVQIAKALSSEARFLIMDEPTSSLTLHESATLFDIIGSLRARGVGLIFVSHKLEEVFSICDTITVIRDGRKMATSARSDVTEGEVIEMMIGRSYRDEYLGELEPEGSPTLEVKSLTRRDSFREASFTARKGEIVGFYGLVGSGRSELARTIIGEYPMDSGSVLVNGREARIRSVADSLYRYKIGYVTENRKEEGLFQRKPNRWNISIAAWPKLVLGLSRKISSRRQASICEKLVADLDIRLSSLGQNTEELSGGNQQKVSLAKWLAADCEILLIDEPTVGVDVGAKATIHKLIWELAKRDKKTIVLISSDLPEMLKLARRIYIMKGGRIVQELKEPEIDFRDKEAVSKRIGQLLV